jgi:hypothetical protein
MFLVLYFKLIHVHQYLLAREVQWPIRPSLSFYMVP